LHAHTVSQHHIKQTTQLANNKKLLSAILIGAETGVNDTCLCSTQCRSTRKI